MTRRPRSRAGRLAVAGGLALTLCLAGQLAVRPARAAADDVLNAARATASSCFSGLTPDAAHTDAREFVAYVTGTVQARLAGDGDWDLAVYDAATGDVVAGAAGFRTNELAEGFVTKGQRLTVQACRYAGSAPTTRLSVGFVEGPPLLPITGPLTQLANQLTGQLGLVDVATPTRASKVRLQALHLDLTESGDATHVRVLARGERDLRSLAEAGLTYTVAVPDVAAADRDHRAADELAAEGPPSDLPSGANAYRRLFDYQLEMKQLAAAHPTLVRLLRLPYPSVEGRDVEGMEITRDPGRLADGKPVFLQLGLHHAREWPSGELALEFGYDLVKNRTRPAVASLLARVRTIVVPVVNPDGFVISREAPAVGSLIGGEDYSIDNYEYKRKNCRPAHAKGLSGACGASQDGAYRGTDINRNYGGFWGGPGASPYEAAESYRGTAPFSEPETRNVQALFSTRPVAVAVSNHTFGNVVLRPPGMFAVRPTTDEPLYRELGDRAAQRNGFVSEFVHELYDVTGSLEDWSYWDAGALTYTFEIGSGFHPPFADGVVAEYLGLSPAAGAGHGGNRGAYYAMLRAAADPRTHSVVRGRAPAGVVLRLHRASTSQTSPVLGADGSAGDPLTFRDDLSTEYSSRGGAFAIAVNPSTRPLVGDRYGRYPAGPAQAPIPLTNPPPALTQRGFSPDRIPFTILGPPAADNGSAVIAISWLNPLADWDLLLMDATGAIVGSSAAFGTTSESIELLDPAPGQYTALVLDHGTGLLSDWQGGVTFATPPRPLRGVREAWTLTCETPDGRVLSERRVVVDRGHSIDVGR
ncbi:MAG TPA: M14 family zinc carboxypeptidase, partial [Sporichthya sp.]|nr:M14 family zinc carboxypeptidase [Sporichthya sp.]